MNLEYLDRSLTSALTIAGGVAGLWAHRREMTKTRHRAALERHKAEEDAKSAYAARELKEYAAQRDFGHIQRDLDQLKANTGHLSEEADQRLDRLERQFERFSGALEVLTEILKQRSGKSEEQ